MSDTGKGERAQTRGSVESSEQRADSVMTPDLMLNPIQIFATSDKQPGQQVVMKGDLPV